MEMTTIKMKMENKAINTMIKTMIKLKKNETDEDED